MKKKAPKKLSVTVGIPTCYGGLSLLKTVKSIRRSKGVGNFRFLVVADRTPLAPRLVQLLKKEKVELTWNKTEGSQHKKLNQIVKKLRGDIFVYTQDDITFEPDTIARIVEVFAKNPQVTMTSTRILPLPPKTWFEGAVGAGVKIVDRMNLLSKSKNHHLMASGRCLAFRVKVIKKFRIPNGVVNGDMFLYLENLRLKGVFKHASDTQVYIRCPQALKDQIGPSSRYQYQQAEMKKYFKFDYSAEYEISPSIKLQAILNELIVNPVYTTLYLGLFVVERLKKQEQKKITNPVWDVDLSTKG